MQRLNSERYSISVVLGDKNGQQWDAGVDIFHN